MWVSVQRLLVALGGTAALTGALALLLFLIAGRWDLPWFWAYVAVYGLFMLSGFLCIDRELLKERWRPGPNAQDKVAVAILKVLGLAHYVVAALDVGRFRWSGEFPVPLQLAGLVVVGVTAGIAVWAMTVNRFFSTVVRIQAERGHHVVTNGPYRLVRHPGYAVITVMILASGVALGSWWSLVPSGVFLLLLVRRTAIEDRFLHDHLEGYSEYASHVRYRLFPGIW